MLSFNCIVYVDPIHGPKIHSINRGYIWKYIWNNSFLNCGCRWKVKNDHRSKFSNLSNWKEEAWKKIRTSTGFEPNCLNWKIYCDDHSSLCLQRCVACEVRVNLNYSTEVHFTLFFCFKSRTWQRKSNRTCARVTWKPGKQQTWQLILRWRKEHPGLHSRGRLNSATYLCNGPGFKPFTLSILLILISKSWLLTSSWGTRASYSDTSCDTLF